MSVSKNTEKESEISAMTTQKPKPGISVDQQSSCVMSDAYTSVRESEEQVTKTQHQKLNVSDKPESLFPEPDVPAVTTQQPKPEVPVHEQSLCVMSDAYSSIKQSQQHMTEEQSKDISKLLHRLGLQKRSDNHITVNEAMVVNTKVLTEEEMSFTELPWTMLRNIIAVNSTARDYTFPIESGNTGTTSESQAQAKGNIRSRFGKGKKKIRNQPNSLSQLDIFMATYLCCEPLLRQILFRKMFLCKQALPFVYKEIHRDSYSVAAWPLKALTFYTETTAFRSEQALEMKTHVISFARFGRPKFSKSQMLNCIISNESNAYATFYSHDCPRGMTPRTVVGFVEMFWLQQPAYQALLNSVPLTLLNVRGDIRTDIPQTCFDFIEGISDFVIVFLEAKQIKEFITSMTGKQSQSKFIFYFTDSLPDNASEVALDELEELQNLFEIPAEAIQEYDTDKNFFNNTTDLLQYVLSVTYDSKDDCIFTRIKTMNSESIKLDTDISLCQQGTKLAFDVLNVMKNELKETTLDEGKTTYDNQDLFKYCKQCLTPVSFSFTKRLSQVLKERKRTRYDSYKKALDAKVSNLRSEKLHITKTVAAFIHSLQNANRSSTLRKYFLSSLREFLERESKSYLPTMKTEKSRVRSHYVGLKAKHPDRKEDIKNLQERLANLDLEIENASFGVEHLIREVGHICDSFQHVKNDLRHFGLPPVEDIADVVASLVLDGETLEIIDGDNVFFASKWIAMVFKKIDEKTGQGRIMTLSVLGLQSSGKSTLLNSMFGVHFSVSSGRCTRGINAQLLPVNQNHTNKVQHVLIIDSEGLRAPELDSATNAGNRDNELATFVTGLGELTLMNIMGENFSDMRDILQIVVHAFLRLKLASGALETGQTCMFVHHNVTDKSASDSMKDGFLKLIQILDRVTADAAEMEGRNEISRFTDVINFNEDTQVYHIPNLWQGNPPMNRVNKGYSKSVADMKVGVIQSALDLKTCFQNLTTKVTLAENLWEGILSENFVFSFRNNMEIKAYRSLDKYVRGQVWGVETKVRGDTLKSISHLFTSATTKKRLLEIKEECTILCHNTIFQLTANLEKTLDEHFDKSSEERDTIQKWRFDKIQWAKTQCNNLRDGMEKDIRKYYESRLLKVERSCTIEKQKEELRRKSSELATSLKGHSLTEDKIQNAFNEIWWPFEKYIRSEISSENFNSDKLFKLFITDLFELHKNDSHQYLLQDTANIPVTKPKFEDLKESHKYSLIEKQDVNWKAMYKKYLHYSISEELERFNTKIFTKLQYVIEDIMNESTVITKTGVDKFVSSLGQISLTMTEAHEQLLFTPSYNIKLSIHVCRYAAFVFGRHNEQYENTNGINVTLKESKREMLIIFKADLDNRRKEDTAAQLFCLAVRKSLKKSILEGIPLQTEIALRKRIPQMKYIFLKEICTELARFGDFANFIKYLSCPKEYAMSWMKEKCNKILFIDDEYMNIVRREASSCLASVRSAFVSLSNNMTISSDKNIDGKKWFKQFNAEMTGLILDSSCFVEFEQQTVQDIAYFSNALRENLDKICLESDFENAQNVQWSGNNPISTLFKRAWGCESYCPFCKEPCALNDHNPSLNKHVCNQHRPKACVGLRETGSEYASCNVCNYAVDSDLTHSCGVFVYICNDGKEECPEKHHSYKDYAKYCPEWDIRPKDSMLDCAKFWLWFLGKYKDELKKHYNYDVSEFVSSWSEIGVDRAIESLDECYN